MTQPQGPQPDPQSNQQPNMGPNPNLGTPPPQIMYVQAPKRPWYQRPGCLIPLILVILVILGMASCTAMMSKTVSEVDKSLNEEKTVVYRVGGDAQDIRVTYTAGSSQSASDSGVTSGWEKEVKVKGIFGAYMSVTSGVNDSGTVSCQILVDGQVVAENSASGQFASASCNADISDISKK